MMSLYKLLKKLSGRVDAGLLESISYLLSQPLLIKESMLANYVREGLIAARPSKGKSKDMDEVGAYTSVPVISYGEINTAVIEFRGALVPHEMNVPCERSPVSYQQIKATMSELIENKVDFIVARFNSGGGAASGLFDLSRWIAENRENVRLIACIDDNAYSAAYGLASSFDTIYVTETSGLGNVGVRMTHEYEKNKKIVKTHIFSGDKKLDGDPSLPLSDRAKEDLQKESDRIYGLFTELVSDNLGVSQERVVQTQAGTFHGAEAIEAKFAHKLGTFDDIIDNIYSGDEMTKDEIKAAEKRIADQEAKLEQAKAKLAKEKVDAGLESTTSENTDTVSTEPTKTATATSDTTVDPTFGEAKAALELAEEQRVEAIKTICATANLDDSVATSLIADKVSVATASKLILSMTSNDTSGSNGTLLTEGDPKSKKNAENSTDLKKSWLEAFDEV